MNVPRVKTIAIRNTAILIIIFLIAYTAFTILTKGIQTINLYDWYILLMDISLGLIIIGAALTKMRQGRANK